MAEEAAAPTAEAVFPPEEPLPEELLVGEEELLPPEEPPP